MPGGTVLTPMGAGTGSWRHNRVAGVGIEPTSGGYEPPEVPLLYPAIYAGLFAPLARKYRKYQAITQLYRKTLNGLEFAENGCIAGDSATSKCV